MASVVPPSSRNPQPSLVALGMLMAAWVADYHADEGDSLAPILQASGLLTTTAAIVYSSLKSDRHRTHAAVWPFTITVVLVSQSIVVGALRAQSIVVVAKAALPLALLVTGMLFVVRALKEVGPTRVRKLVIAFALASALLKPISWWLSSPSAELSEVRYEILSGSIVLLMGYCVVALSSGVRARDVAIALLLVVLVAASVTRTYILVFGVMVAAHVVLSMRAPNGLRIIKGAGALALGAALLAAATGSSCDEVKERWEARVAYSDDIGFDLTAASRIAEAHFQFESLVASPVSLVAGQGAGARTSLSGEYADLFFAVAPEHEVSSIGFGHTDAISVLFVGGVIIGGLFLLMILDQLRRSVITLRRTAGRIAKSPEAFVASWGATSVIGITVYGLFGGTFADRSASLHYGVAFGLMLWGWDHFVRIQSDEIRKQD